MGKTFVVYLSTTKNIAPLKIPAIRCIAHGEPSVTLHLLKCQVQNFGIGPLDTLLKLHASVASHLASQNTSESDMAAHVLKKN